MDKKETIETICRLIMALAQEHPHPDVITRIYGVMKEVDAAMIGEILRFKESQKNAGK